MSRVLPILFNTDMVRAILDGRKTVTRRCVKHNVDAILHSPYHAENPETPDKVLIEKLCQPPYQPGDILYVRETWAHPAENTYWYKADSRVQNILWHSSIHMPKKAARIWLKVTDIRVERLQDITEDEAKAEGASIEPLIEGGEALPARWDFIKIWDSTIKKSDRHRYDWKANPWVWVIEFERYGKPED